MKIRIIFGILLFAVATLVLWACTKEDPITPIASFTTSLTDNQAFAGEPFAVYLKNVKGDFVSLYTGENPATTYDPNNPAATGVSIKTDISAIPDSTMVTYSSPGTFNLTLVVGSSGNLSKDFKLNTSSIPVTVVDRRNLFRKFTIDKIDGQLSEDGTHIYFYAAKSIDLTAKKASFQLNSLNAQVTVNGVAQVTGTSVQDFSALSPGDSLGRPVDYLITAGNGAIKTYTVQYKLREPYTGKQLLSLAVSSLGATFIPDETGKTVEILYLAGTNLQLSKVKATVSVGASALIGTKNISDKEQTIDLDAATKVTVNSEDGSKQDYSVVKTAIEKFSAFSFTQSGSNILSPAPNGNIDYVKKTINVNVLNGTDVTGLVASFTGLSTFTAQVGATIITSGVTEIDYTNPVMIDLYMGARKLDTYTVTVTKVSK